MAKTKKNMREKRYTEEGVQKCLSEIRSGISIRSACIRFGIPRSTIKFRMSKNYKQQIRSGPPTALRSEQETELVNWILKMARKGFPVTKYRLINSVMNYLEHNPNMNVFKNGKPSSAWFNSFMSRHKVLSIRKPESVTKASANVTELDIRNWFKEVLTVLEEEGLSEVLMSAGSVLNGDESSFYLDPSIDKVISRRGEKNYIVDQGPTKKNITVMFTCAADGKMFPPMVVLPYKKIPTDITRSVPADWGLAKTDSGWMTRSCFLKYIKFILQPQLAKENALPAIYFIDDHSSHTAWETAEECRKMGIHLVYLYANCTRILQPLDVAVFKPMKGSWLKVVDDWKCLNPNKYLKTENFAPLLAKAIKSVESKIIQNGFKACGLYPFNENNIDYSKCLANSLPVGENFENKGTDTRQITSLTFPIVRSKAVEILTLIGPDRISLYKRNNPDDFPSDEDKILARVYKLLEPLDSSSNMNIPGSNTTKMHIEPNMHIAEFVNMDNVESVTEVEYLDKQESYESGMLDFYQSTSEDPLKECVSDLNTG
ncbi:LOW QUALITY PROTEIN: tigger transposable element-derived protein 6-like [Malaya genurostris]|uniref:LOW QUALITY PROTEIN: tigger transposable element-derived protein 6-like n=1 Tax=Malaya genurostris TaxID=325434 RepID=UPI0026F39C35|nr:LOW QUALITY PROTEIN: tigger transposable element-derived protein 6-like [Malaya genurostris]